MLVSFRGQTRFRMLAFPGQVLDGELERPVDGESKRNPILSSKKTWNADSSIQRKMKG